MARVAAPVTVDAATVRLLEVEHQVAAGTADAQDLVAAKRALRDAVQLEAEVADEQQAVDTIRARLEAIAGIEQVVGYVEGDDLRAGKDELIAAFVDARDALVRLYRARAAIAPKYRRQILHAYDLGRHGDLPVGVTVDPVMGRDAVLSTPHGSWRSDALADDPTPALVEEARLIDRGRTISRGYVERIERKWYRPGVGIPLPLPLPGQLDEGAA